MRTVSVFTGFGRKKREIDYNLSEVSGILKSLNGKWDLGQRFTLSGDIVSSKLTEGLNIVFGKLESFISGLTSNSVELGGMAPGMQKISGKVREASENLSSRSESMEICCRSLSCEMKEAAEKSVAVMEKSSMIVSEISRARTLTSDSVVSLSNVERNMETLSKTISELEESSKSIADIIENISGLSDRTGLLSLNAFIEAARAGSSGAGFAVIAKEIRQLSDQSGQAASEIKDALLGIGRMIEETVQSVAKVRESVSSSLSVSAEADSALTLVADEHSGFHGQMEIALDSVKKQEQTVSGLLAGIVEIAASGKAGVAESRKLESFAEKIKILSDRQLESSGKFVLPQYRKAEAEIVRIAEDHSVKGFAADMNRILAERISRLPFIELIYLTDIQGTQVSANVFRDTGCSEKGLTSVGRNWSAKEWYRCVRDSGKNYISDIYRSEATGAYCMTISVPVQNDGVLKGVLAADINFENLLDI